MHRRVLLLSLFAVALGLALWFLPGDKSNASPGAGAAPQVGSAEGEGSVMPASPKAGATTWVEAPPAGPPTRKPAPAEVALPEIEYRAELAVSPKGQRDEPIAGFHFEIVQARPFGMNRWRTVRVLAAGKTGHDGRAALAFLGPEFLHYEARNAQELEDRIYFCARLCEPGYQERFVPLYRKDRHNNTGPFTAAIEARLGGTVRGCLVNLDGEPIEGQLMFVRSTDLKGTGRAQTAGRRATDPDGRFLLHVDSDSSTGGKLQGACLAWAAGIGTGTLADASWPMDDLPQDLEIAVSGAGELRGIVRDPGGAPAAGLDLVLVRSDAMGPLAKAHTVGASAAPFLKEDGLFAVELRTDAEGRFAAEGLSLAPYAVHLKQGHLHSRDSSVTLTEEPVLADGREVELSFAAKGLVVQLLAADGDPWSGKLSLVDPRLGLQPLPSTWPDKPAVLVYPADWRAGAWVCASEDPDSRCAAKSLGGGAVHVATEDARDLLVCVIGGNKEGGLFCSPPVHITMEPGQGSFSPVAFQAQIQSQAQSQAQGPGSGSAVGLGQLIVNAQVINANTAHAAVLTNPLGEDAATGPGEREPVPHQASSATRLLIQHAETEFPVLEASHSSTTAPYRFTIPPGSYTARAWNDHWRRGIGAGPIAYGAETAAVSPGATTTMDLNLDGGERLTLQIKPQSPTGAADAERSWAQLRLDYEDGRTLPIHYRYYHSSGPAYGIPPSYSHSWEPGVIHTSLPLPAGRGWIRGRVTDTGREIEVPVEIILGKPLTLML